MQSTAKQLVVQLGDVHDFEVTNLIQLAIYLHD